MIIKTLARVAAFYDQRKVGETGALGFRRSSDLNTLVDCVEIMLREGLIIQGESRFLDLGCADGRVNVLFSYLVRLSVGIELDEWTAEEYMDLKRSLENELEAQGLSKPPNNISIFQGDSTGTGVYRSIRDATGADFEDFDLFYTYLVMHEEFAELIKARGRRGSVFLVYGVDRVLPRYHGLRLLSFSPVKGILAADRKE
jgi:SAM-dependent methyltransferase